MGLLRPLTVFPSEMVYWGNLPTVTTFQGMLLVYARDIAFDDTVLSATLGQDGDLKATSAVLDGFR